MLKLNDFKEFEIGILKDDNFKSITGGAYNTFAYHSDGRKTIYDHVDNANCTMFGNDIPAGHAYCDAC